MAKAGNFVDPTVAALNRELAKVQAERLEKMAAEFEAFRKTHKVTDAQLREMIRAVGDGRARTLEEAFDLARIGIDFPPTPKKKKKR